METIQQQSFPVTEARLLGPADAPLSKSYPKTWLILLLALVGGSVLSFGAAALRDILDRVFRSSEQMEDWPDDLLRAFLEVGDELEDYCWFVYAVCQVA